MVAVAVQLTSVECYLCSVPFGMPEGMRDNRQRDGQTFYCPVGHPQCYGDSEGDRLRARVKQLESTLLSERDQLAAAKGELAKVRKRVANGVCPCCHRSFANVARHMKSQHPDER